MLPPLLADVNIASRVVQFLRSQGVDVRSEINLTKENGISGFGFSEILKLDNFRQKLYPIWNVTLVAFFTCLILEAVAIIQPRENGKWSWV